MYICVCVVVFVCVCMCINDCYRFISVWIPLWNNLKQEQSIIVSRNASVFYISKSCVYLQYFHYYIQTNRLPPLWSRIRVFPSFCLFVLLSGCCLVGFVSCDSVVLEPELIVLLNGLRQFPSFWNEISGTCLHYLKCPCYLNTGNTQQKCFLRSEISFSHLEGSMSCCLIPKCKCLII